MLIESDPVLHSIAKVMEANPGHAEGSTQVVGAPGLTARSKKLLRAPGIATRSKDAPRGSWHRY